jgi:ubiquinone biosynthesis protein Coq4
MKKLSDWVQTIWLLLHDYGRTDQVFRLYDLTPRFIQRGLVRKLSRYPEGKKLLRGDFNTVAGLMQDREYLQSFPEGSLGHALGQLQLPNLYEIQKSSTPLSTAFVTIHDPLHVLTGYGTSAHDEACLQAFSFHHLPVPAPLVIAFGYALSNPRSIPAIYRGYKWGKRVNWLLLVDWTKYLGKQVDQVKRELGI